MEYKVITGKLRDGQNSEQATFSRDCAKAMEEGWEPIGGPVFVEKVMSAYHYSQGFIRKPKEPGFWAHVRFWER